MDDETKVQIESPPIIVVPPKQKILLHEPDETFDVTFCCAKGNRTSCDKALLQWFSKTLVSGAVLSFCFVQLAHDRGDSAFLCSTLSLILGHFLAGTSPPAAKKDTKP